MTMPSPASLQSSSSTMMTISNSVIAGGTYTQYNQQTVNHSVQAPTTAWEHLQRAVAPGAFHNSGERFDPPKCHPNTRVAVMNRIMDWILGQNPDTKSYLMMWLNGAAGAGKSAIAQSIAERCYEEGYLVGSFVFARSDPNRNHAKRLFPTVAYQMALALPQTSHSILTAIERDPLIFTRSLATQFSVLLIQPLQELACIGFFAQNPICPCLVIMDGLDECTDRKVQVEILDIISQAIQSNQMPLIFLIASRPEHDISSKMKHPNMRQIVSHLVLDDEYQPDDDIRRFLGDKFDEIKNTHPFKHRISSTWPTDDVIKSLVKKSSGQFIYASTVIRYVDSSRHQPENRLQVIQNLRPALGSHPFAELDALYMHIFSCAEQIDLVLLIIAFVHLARQAPRTSILESILGLESGATELLFCDLPSIISLQQVRLPYKTRGPNYWIKVLHASIYDFLFDSGRSKGYHIDEARAITEISQKCIQYITREQFTAWDIVKNDVALHFLRDRLKGMIMCEELRAGFHSISLQFWHVVAEGIKLDYLHENPALSGTHDLNFFYIPIILSIFDSVDFEGVEYLRAQNLSAVYRFFNKWLEIYLQDQRLTLMLAVFDLIISRPDSMTRMNVFQMFEPEYLLFDVDLALFEIDSRGLRLISLEVASDVYDPPDSYYPYPRQSIELLHQFYMDSANEELPWRLNGERFGNAAEFCLAYISDSSTCPFTKRPQHCGAFLKLMSQAADSSFFEEATGLDSDGDSDIHGIHASHSAAEYQFGGSCITRCANAVLFLEYCLERADPSKELTDLCRRTTFRQLSEKMPDKGKKASQVVTDYLKKHGVGTAENKGLADAGPEPKHTQNDASHSHTFNLEDWA
ncbi:hypothetical protein CVT26_007841 [Gymnopilus dilepis]|uniref:Nephrocystin 3-like N-terminal domain-containing protein n=1 Tax=Gymnopilus dilepis TaxID=231916 RepID=A0A409W805_9AGAR|nr:hypothetical protein CVT26_007841 [Gymnopilus dilepis]